MTHLNNKEKLAISSSQTGLTIKVNPNNLIGHASSVSLLSLSFWIVMLFADVAHATISSLIPVQVFSVADISEKMSSVSWIFVVAAPYLW